MKIKTCLLPLVVALLGLNAFAQNRRMGTELGNGTDGVLNPADQKFLPAFRFTDPVDISSYVCFFTNDSKAHFDYDPSYVVMRRQPFSVSAEGHDGTHFDTLKESLEWLAKYAHLNYKCDRSNKTYYSADELSKEAIKVYPGPISRMGFADVFSGKYPFLNFVKIQNGKKLWFHLPNHQENLSEILTNDFYRLCGEKDVACGSGLAHWSKNFFQIWEATLETEKISVIDHALHAIFDIYDDFGTKNGNDSLIDALPYAYEGTLHLDFQGTINFDWGNAKDQYLSLSDKGVAIELYPEEGLNPTLIKLDLHVSNHGIIVPPVLLTPKVALSIDGQRLIDQINQSWGAQEPSVKETFKDLVDRPSIAAYLDNVAQDMKTLLAFRKITIDPIANLSRKSVLALAALDTLKRAFRQRLLLSADAYYQGLSGSEDKAVAELVKGVDPEYWKELSSALQLDSLVWPQMYGTLVQVGPGPFHAVDHQETNHIAALQTDLDNALTILTSTWPNKVDRLANSGCTYILTIAKVLNELESHYFHYLPEIAIDSRFSQSNYVKTLIATLSHLNNVHYQSESPRDFLTATVPGWEAHCNAKAPEVKKEADGELAPYEKKN